MGIELQKIIDEIKTRGLTAYEISKNTPLSEDGINKILSGASKNPRQTTLLVLQDYLFNDPIKSEDKIDKNEGIEYLIAQRVSELVKKELKERDAYVEKVLKELMESIIHLIPLVDQMSRKLDKIERDINEGKDLIRNKKM